MRISPINTSVQTKRYYSSAKVNELTPSRVTAQDTINFKSNYYSVYKDALTKDIKQFSAIEKIFKALCDSARFETLIKTRDTSRINPNNIKQTLQNITDLGRDREKILIDTKRYPSPLITVYKECLSFHHPEYGEFGNGNITFWMEGDCVNVLRPKDFHEFHPNNRLKMRYDIIQDGGGIINKVYYNEDGSKCIWKNLLLT